MRIRTTWGVLGLAYTLVLELALGVLTEGNACRTTARVLARGTYVDGLAPSEEGVTFEEYEEVGVSKHLNKSSNTSLEAWELGLTVPFPLLGVLGYIRPTAHF